MSLLIMDATAATSSTQSTSLLQCVLYNVVLYVMSCHDMTTCMVKLLQKLKWLSSNP